MRAVILAGGRGTRLRPYTTVLPKPLMPVGERPILELIISQLHRAGVTRVDLLVGHLGELIQAYFAEGATLPAGMELVYHYEKEPLGTAGALHLLEPPEEPFLVMNGDILTTLDYAEFMEVHRSNGSRLTIATHLKDVRLELGVIEGGGGDVTGYVEKPTLNYEVSMGIYAYDPSALAHVPEGRFDFPDLVLKLLAQDEPVSSYRFDGEWFDIGTAAEHAKASEAYHKAPERFEGFES